MRKLKSLAAVACLAVGAGVALNGQITNPLPSTIEKRGIAVQIRDVARLPDTRGLRPAAQDVAPAAWARVSYVRDLPDGRRFANDSRGFLYLLDRNNQPSVYANVGRGVSRMRSTTGWRAASSAFRSTPSSRRTACSTRCTASARWATRRRPTSSRPASVRPTSPTTTSSPSGAPPIRRRPPSTVRGASCCAWRTSSNNLTHPFGAAEFNPTAKPGDADYGLLYTSGSDLGFSNGGGPNASNPGQTQRLDSVITAILRIDPRSPSVSKGTKGLGDYTIPPSNRFAADNDPKTLGEIYAYGFRNAHRLSWDQMDGTMYASDIGMDQIEEVNIVKNGGNYGWMKREGHFENGVSRPGGTLAQLFPLPADVAERQDERRVHLPGGDLRPPRRPGRVRRLRLLRHAFRRCAASSYSATCSAGACSPPTWRR